MRLSHWLLSLSPAFELTCNYSYSSFDSQVPNPRTTNHALPSLCLVVGSVATDAVLSMADRGAVSRHDLSCPLATAQGLTACLPHNTNLAHSPLRRISCHPDVTEDSFPMHTTTTAHQRMLSPDSPYARGSSLNSIQGLPDVNLRWSKGAANWDRIVETLRPIARSARRMLFEILR